MVFLTHAIYGCFDGAVSQLCTHEEKQGEGE